MLHAYDQRFDMKENLENFCELNKASPRAGRQGHTHSLMLSCGRCGPASTSTPTRQGSRCCMHAWGLRPPVTVSEMDRSWRHANRSSKKKASPAPRTACSPGGRAPAGHSGGDGEC